MMVLITSDLPEISEILYKSKILMISDILEISYTCEISDILVYVKYISPWSI